MEGQCQERKKAWKSTLEVKCDDWLNLIGCRLPTPCCYWISQLCTVEGVRKMAFHIATAQGQLITQIHQLAFDVFFFRIKRLGRKHICWLI